ncbi:reverse transcriptase domain-containing protein [Tanacetum coccineum]
MLTSDISTDHFYMKFPERIPEYVGKGITTRSGVAYQGPTIPTTTSSPPKVVEREPKVTKDTMLPTNNGSTKDVQPLVVQVQSHVPNFEPVVTPVSALMPNLKPTISYPSRRNDEKRREKANDQIEKFYEIFKDLSFEISLADALILMPKFASTLKALIGNKEKLSEMARTPLNEHCSAVILNKLPKKLGDPDKFLIPCDFPRIEECLALADLGASINLMPLSVWKKLSLPELTPTCMTLELADRSITKPIGIAEDVYLKVGKFKFSADFVVVDFDADSRVPLILERSFLKTERALINVYEGELTLRVGKEAVTFNLDQTSRYSSNYDDMTANQIDVIEMACKNRASWSDKLDDALWAFHTTYKTPVGCTSYKLVYGKACHLLIELEHKAYWALKHANFDLETVGDHRKVQLNELNELRDHAYENSLIYKEKTKRIHDSKIKNRVFNVGDQVLFFNSRLKMFSGKLKSRWFGPFTIAHVFPYGTVELSQNSRPNFKVNGHRIKHYFGGDVPQLVVPDLQTFPKDK